MRKWIGYSILFLSLFLVGCESINNKRIKKDIIGINEQLYEVEKSQIKNTGRIQKLDTEMSQIKTEISKKKFEDKEGKKDFNNLYQSAYTYYIQQKYDLSAKSFSKLTDGFLTNPLFDNALFWQAESYSKLKKTDLALRYYQMVYGYFPFGDKSDEALFRIGSIFYEKKDFSKAKLAFNKLIVEYPSSDLYKQSLDMLSNIRSKMRRKR